MQVKNGISTWVWTSPATTADLERLIPHAAGLGYEVVEVPIEEPGQFDPDLLWIEAGQDNHFTDPITDLGVY